MYHMYPSRLLLDFVQARAYYVAKINGKISPGGCCASDESSRLYIKNIFQKTGESVALRAVVGSASVGPAAVGRVSRTRSTYYIS